MDNQVAQVSARLAHSHIGIITHTYATGPAQELETFLKPRCRSVVFIGHPLPFCEDKRSVYRRSEEGQVVDSRTARNWAVPDVFLYIKDVIYSLVWCLRRSGSLDILVTVDCLNAFAGWVLKKLGRTKAVIFYTIDYVPQRFKNRFLNYLYYRMDFFAVASSDQVWNLSPVMVAEREKRGLSQRYRKKQLTVPIGTDLSHGATGSEFENRWTIGFMGHLRDGQGVELLIDALPAILQRLPQARLMIIGSGPLETRLKTRAHSLGVSEHVTFTGFVPDHQTVMQFLRACSIGVAPYVDSPETFARYTDPGKPKAYLASGLPVIITRVTPVADEIDREKCGLAIDDSEAALVEAVVSLLTDETELKIYRENAIRFAMKYDWSKVFADAFASYWASTERQSI